MYQNCKVLHTEKKENKLVTNKSIGYMWKEKKICRPRETIVSQPLPRPSRQKIFDGGINRDTSTTSQTRVVSVSRAWETRIKSLLVTTQ